MTTRFLVIGGAGSISSHCVRTLCSNNYRHHQYPEKRIPLFVTDLLDGRTVPLHGDGGNIRDWLHVGDHVRGIELVRTGGRLGETCIVGGEVELTNRELTELDLRACLRVGRQRDLCGDHKGHGRRYAVACTEIREERGYRPRVSFASGLAETVAWWRANRDRWEPLKAAVR